MGVILQIAGQRIRLQSNSEQVEQQWLALFAGWPDLWPEDVGQTDSLSAQTGSLRYKFSNETAVDIHLHLELAGTLPALPAVAPLFVNDSDRPDRPAGNLSVYAPAPGRFLLAFQDVAAVALPQETNPNRLHGVITPACLLHGFLEDVTTTSLAPLLRRRGYYLIHAFSLSRDGRALLLCGPSGCGKTTSGLALLRAGWRYLGNDVALLQQRPDGIYALPMPGPLAIRRHTLKLLPWLGEKDHYPADPSEPNRVQLPIDEWFGGWAAASRVTAVCFPTIEERPDNLLEPLSQSVCLARLMEQSVDRWDQQTLSRHVNLLHCLSRQSDAYTVRLGRDPAQLPDLLKTMDYRL
jgi:hypothetical protein